MYPSALPLVIMVECDATIFINSGNNYDFMNRNNYLIYILNVYSIHS